jgi:hypothetical protein
MAGLASTLDAFLRHNDQAARDKEARVAGDKTWTTGVAAFLL